MLGQNIRLPIDMLYGAPPTNIIMDRTSYAQQLRKQIELVNHYARQNLKVAADTQKRTYDHKTSYSKYRLGQAVWVFDPTRPGSVSPKLVLKWRGPFIIMGSVLLFISSKKHLKRGRQPSTLTV